MNAPTVPLPALDLEVLEQLKTLQKVSNPRLLRELFSLYQRTLKEKGPLLRDAVSRADNQALFQSAHALKSSSANVGAVEFARLLAEIELLGRGGNATAAAPFLARFEMEFARVEMAVKDLLAEQPE